MYFSYTHKMITIDMGMNIINILYVESYKRIQMHCRLQMKMTGNTCSFVLFNFCNVQNFVIVEVECTDNIQSYIKDVEYISFYWI